MKNTIRVGKRFLPILVLGLVVGFLLSFGCGDEKIPPDVNYAPVFNQIGNQTVDLGGTLNFTVTAGDPDGDILSFSAINLPPGAVFDPETQSFTWTPTPFVNLPGTYDVTFIVSDGVLSDNEKITITVRKIGASGAAYTGIYPTIASNFEGDCNITCEEPPFQMGMELYGLPAPGCKEFDLFLLQNDELIIGMGGPGTIYNDGSFTTSYFFSGGPFTIKISGTGNISADTIEGSIYLKYEYEAEECSWSFDYFGPGPHHNATVTVNGFTEHVGEHVYAFVIEDWVWVVGCGLVPVLGAMGGGEIGADGSIEIQLKPELSDGNYELWVVVDADGNIDEKILYMVSGGTLPVTIGDWYKDDGTLVIDGGSGSVILNKEDFKEELP